MIEFTLSYSGPLRPNGDRLQKHILRRAFHAQLRYLWDNPPKLAPGILSRVRPAPNDPSFHVPVGGFRFLPVISETGVNGAEVEITILRREAGGSIITREGDLDNRLKTLFDALKVPSQAELPGTVSPAEDEVPFWCVVEDDQLITAVSVRTHRLLASPASDSDVQLLLTVRGRQVSELTISRRGFAHFDE